jgi:hypothetical protein
MVFATTYLVFVFLVENLFFLLSYIFLLPFVSIGFLCKPIVTNARYAGICCKIHQTTLGFALKAKEMIGFFL